MDRLQACRISFDFFVITTLRATIQTQVLKKGWGRARCKIVTMMVELVIDCIIVLTMNHA